MIKGVLIIRRVSATINHQDPSFKNPFLCIEIDQQKEYSLPTTYSSKQKSSTLQWEPYLRFPMSNFDQEIIVKIFTKQKKFHGKLTAKLLCTFKIARETINIEQEQGEEKITGFCIIQAQWVQPLQMNIAQDQLKALAEASFKKSLRHGSKTLTRKLMIQKQLNFIVTDLENALGKFFLSIKETEQPIEFSQYAIKQLDLQQKKQISLEDFTNILIEQIKLGQQQQQLKSQQLDSNEEQKKSSNDYETPQRLKIDDPEKEEIKQLQTQLQEKEKIIQEVQVQDRKIRKQYSLTQQKLEEIQSFSVTHETKLKLLEDEISNLTEVNKELFFKNFIFYIYLKRKEENSKLLDSKLVTVECQKKLQKAKEKKRNLKAELQDLKQEIQIMKDQKDNNNDDQEEEIISLNKQVTKLRNQLEQKIKDMEIIQKEKSDIFSEIEKYKEVFNSQTQQIENYEKNINELNETINKQDQQQNLLKQKNQEFNEQINSLNSQLEEKSQLKQKIQQQEDENQSLSQQITQLKESQLFNDKYKDNLEQQFKEKELIQQEKIMELKERLKESEKQYNELKMNQIYYKEQINQLENKKDSESKNSSELQQQIQALRESLIDKTQLLDKAQRNIDKLEINLLNIEANSPSRKISLKPTTIIQSEINTELNSIAKLLYSLPNEEAQLSKQFNSFQNVINNSELALDLEFQFEQRYIKKIQELEEKYEKKLKKKQSSSQQSTNYNGNFNNNGSNISKIQAALAKEIFKRHDREYANFLTQSQVDRAICEIYEKLNYNEPAVEEVNKMIYKYDSRNNGINLQTFCIMAQEIMSSLA